MIKQILPLILMIHGIQSKQELSEIYKGWERQKTKSKKKKKYILEKDNERARDKSGVRTI